MAAFGGQDWFKSQTPESQETAPTLDNLMKKKTAKKSLAGTPVTFSLDELMKTGGQEVAQGVTAQPPTQSVAAPAPTQAAAAPLAPPSDIPDPNAPATDTGWKYDFSEYQGTQTNTDYGTFSTGSQANTDVDSSKIKAFRDKYGLFGLLAQTDVEIAQILLRWGAESFTPTMVTQKDKQGNPLVTGYYDYYGHWVTTEDYSDINTARKKWQDWLDDPANRPRADYDEVKRKIQEWEDQLNDPDYLANLEAQGINWVDTFLGYEPGGWAAEQARLRGQVGLLEEGQQGLTPEQRARMERDVALQMQNARESTAQMLAGLQAGGHGVDVFRQSEAIAGGLATAGAQAYAAIEDEHYARQKSQWAALNKQWETSYMQGSTSMGQFLQAQQQQANQIMGALGLELTTISAQFEADLSIWTAMADNYYKDVLLTMEYHGLVSQTELSDYEQAMAKQTADLLRRATEAQEKANETDIWDILGLIGEGFGLILAV